MTVSQKEILRKDILLKRDSLQETERAEKSKKIQKYLFDTREFNTALKIAFFLNFGSEVKTFPMVEKALQLGKEIVVPSCDLKHGKIYMSPLAKMDSLKKGKYGIYEVGMEKKEIVPAGAIDLIIVPGCVFDYQGSRIGYGKGYYDRFLKYLKGKVTLIGLAFQLQVVPLIPQDKNDIPVDIVITETGIHRATT